MCLKLNHIIHHLVDISQAGFQLDKSTGDLIRLALDGIHYCNYHDVSALFLFCDQSKAYDRVNWHFMKREYSLP